MHIICADSCNRTLRVSRKQRSQSTVVLLKVPGPGNLPSQGNTPLPNKLLDLYHNMLQRCVSKTGLRANILLSRASSAAFASTTRAMSASTLVVAEHDGAAITQGTLATITAATAVGGPVDVLVYGSGAGVAAAAANAASTAGVRKALTLDAACLANPVSEDTAKAVLAVAQAGKYSHIFAASSNHGKNFMPRAAAMMDCAPLSDIISVGVCARAIDEEFLATLSHVDVGSMSCACALTPPIPIPIPPPTSTPPIPIPIPIPPPPSTPPPPLPASVTLELQAPHVRRQHHRHGRDEGRRCVGRHALVIGSTPLSSMFRISSSFLNMNFLG